MKTLLRQLMCAACLLLPSLVQAQNLGLSPAHRVRVTLKGAIDSRYADEWLHEHRYTGRVVSYSYDSLIIQIGNDQLSLSASAIRRLEASNGARNATGRGALIGAIGGVLVVGAMAGAEQSRCEGMCFGPSSGELFLAGFGVGVLAGALVGAVVGSTVRLERWVYLPRSEWMRLRTVAGIRAVGLTIAL